jgi:predicted transcriptional regulator
MQTAKQSARQLIELVPDQANWEDIMYEFYVKQKLEKGLQAAQDGRTVSHDEAKKRLMANVD